MGRSLGALLLLFVAACSAPTPTEAPSAEPPVPTDWFELDLDGMGYAATYPRQIRYRQHPVDVVVKFRNAGDKTLKKPAIQFKIKPNDHNGEAVTVVINGDGDGWKCEIARESATCRSSAQVAPGEELPQIDIGVAFEWENDGRGYLADYFTATFGDVVYEGSIAYDTSV
ncbi:hypothetical protein AB0E59_24260 [Lentzea sp. NPDC034063]|uniref:hypothetical protein n=1 Tax=unclassified Lentzea TaxID=2643253 RepID=UPI0033DD4C3F